MAELTRVKHKKTEPPVHSHGDLAPTTGNGAAFSLVNPAYLKAVAGTPSNVARTQTGGTVGSVGVDEAYYDFTPDADETLDGIVVTMATAYAGTLTLKVFKVSDQTLLASSAATSGSAGVFTLSLSTPLALAAGVTYRIGATSSGTSQFRYMHSDVTVAYTGFTFGANGYYGTGFPNTSGAAFNMYRPEFELRTISGAKSKGVVGPLDPVDVGGTLTGHGGKAVIVKADETGFEYGTVASGGGAIALDRTATFAGTLEPFTQADSTTGITGWTNRNGTAGVLSNEAYGVSADEPVATKDSVSLADGFVSARIRHSTGVTFRGNTYTDLILVQWHGGKVDLHTRSAGTWSAVLATANFSDDTKYHTLAAVFSGSTIDVYMDNAKLFTYTTTTHQAQTQAGLRLGVGGITSSRADEFRSGTLAQANLTVTNLPTGYTLRLDGQPFTSGTAAFGDAVRLEALDAEGAVKASAYVTTGETWDYLAATTASSSGTAKSDLARHRAYTLTNAAHASYPDATDIDLATGALDYANAQKLTRGDRVPNAAFNSGNYVGWDAADAVATFDLSTAREITGLRLYGLLESPNSIYRATGVKVEYSDDNVTYTVAVDRTGLTAGTGGPIEYAVALDWSGKGSHRYWRVTATRSATAGHWLFLQQLELVG